ncbi:hypothetical protein PT286_03420 [Neisseriaceae bacterium ESL0693]|nr:hypothetical protein [Neisseriaceae bacterium ESL0693]
MHKLTFDTQYYDAAASLLHNHQLVSLILNTDLLPHEKRQYLDSRDLNLVIGDCIQASVVFNQMAETMGKLLLERQTIQQQQIDTNPLVDHDQMLQLAGHLFTLIGGLSASIDRILHQAVDIRLSEAG